MFKNLQIKIWNRSFDEEVMARIPVSVVDLLNKEDQPGSNDKDDVDIDRIRYKLLIRRLCFHDFNSELHQVEFMNPLAGNRVTSIVGDAHLRSVCFRRTTGL
jgi:hypothetical protein